MLDLNIQPPEPLSLHYCAICTQLVRPRMLQLDRLEAVEYKGQYYHLTCVEGSQQPLDPGLHDHIRRLKNTLTGMPDLPQPKKGSGRSAAMKGSGLGVPLTTQETGEGGPRGRARKSTAGHRVVVGNAAGNRRPAPVGLFVFLGGVGVALLLVAVYFAARAGVTEAPPPSPPPPSARPHDSTSAPQPLAPLPGTAAVPPGPGSGPAAGSTVIPALPPPSVPAPTAGKVPPAVTPTVTPTGKNAGGAGGKADPSAPLDPTQAAAMLAACKAGDLAAVKAELAKDRNLVFAKDATDSQPMHFAAEHGDLALAQVLVDAGADVNVHHKFGRTPLHRAVEGAKLEMVRWLLDHGADINGVSNSNKSALYYAAELGTQPEHAEIVKLLLGRKADATLRDTDDKKTAYEVAKEGQRAALIQAFEQAGVTK